MHFKKGEDYIINTDRVHRNSLMGQKYDISHKDWSNDEHTKYIDIRGI